MEDLYEQLAAGSTIEDRNHSILQIKVPVKLALFINDSAHVKFGISGRQKFSLEFLLIKRDTEIKKPRKNNPSKKYFARKQ